MSRDGRELFYVSSDRRMFAVPVRSTTPSLDLGLPMPLFSVAGRSWLDYDPDTDGKRFLAIVPQMWSGEQPLTVVMNWTSAIQN